MNRLLSSRLLHWPIAVVMLAALAGCSREQQPQPPTATQPIEKPVAPKPWSPIPFDQANLQINDESLFFLEFANAIKKSAKGQYETTAEHKKRLLDVDTVIRPFSSKESYALVDRFAELVYNADKGGYERKMASSSTCTPIDNTMVDLYCPLTSVTDSTEKYDGTNALGVTAQITKESGRDLALAVKKANLSNPKFKAQSQFFRELNIDCQVPLQRAKELDGKKILGALVVSIREPRVVSMGNRHSSATISAPFERHFEDVGIPVEIKKTVCFVEETKEVLHVADVR